MLISISTTGVLFHLTPISTAARIVQEGFHLVPSDGTEAEERHGRAFYLSTARSPRSSYFDKIGTFSTILELDRASLAARSKISPVDYWQHPQRDEMEDRVFSERAALPSSVIHAVHTSADAVRAKPNAYFQLRKWCLRTKTPMYVYDTPENLRALNRKALVEIELHKDMAVEVFPYHRYRRDPRDVPMRAWMELYLRPCPQKGVWPKTVLGRGAAMRYESLRYSDVGQQLSADMHNAKSSDGPDRQYLERLVRVLRTKKWNTTEFLSFLQTKWYP